MVPQGMSVVHFISSLACMLLAVLSNEDMSNHLIVQPLLYER